MKPHSAAVFNEAVDAGASANEMDILLAVLRRDYQVLRDLEAIEQWANRLRVAVLNSGISPATALKIKRAAASLKEIR